MAGANTTTQVGGLSAGGGAGTVTQVSVVTANGFSGTVATDTTTPAITIIAGAITPTTVKGLTISTTTGTLTLANGSTLVTSGANSITLTSSGATNVTLPTTGTLATLTGTETLTNKTLTTPKIGSIYGSNSHSVFTMSDASSAVNYWDIYNSNTAVALTARAAGTDTNIGVNLYGKGAGSLVLGISTGATIEMYGIQAGLYTTNGTFLVASGIASLASVTANTATVTNTKQTTLNTSGTAATGLGISDITTIEIAAGTTVSSMTQTVYLTNGTNGASNAIWNLYTGSGSLNVLELLSTSGIKMGGSTSGYVTVKPSAVAGDYTLTLPTTDGTSGQYLKTDGSGVTSWDAPAGGSTTTASNSKAANQTVVSSTTLVDCTGLSFPIGANETWNFDMTFRVNAGASGGFKWAFTLPSGATGDAAGSGVNNLTTNFASVAMTTGKGATVVLTQLTDVMKLYGTVVNSTTAGTVQFQFAQNASNAVNTTLYAIAVINAWKIS